MTQPTSGQQPGDPAPLQPLLRAVDLRKSFGRTQALKGANLTVLPGQVHALLGGNGAGKSTLINIVSGTLQPDSGTLEVSASGPAGRAGVAVVHQELAVLPHLTVAENVAARNLRGRLLYPRAQVRREAATALESLGVDLTSVPLNRTAKGLALHQLQLMEIARAIGSGAHLILLDEPTASLSSEETERLFTVVRRLAAAGFGLVFVSHRMQEIRQIADVVSVMRDGRTVLDGVGIGEVTDGQILGAMTPALSAQAGTAPATVPNPVAMSLVSEAGQDAPDPDEVATRAGLRLADDRSGFAVEVAPGEVLGLAGAPGGPDRLLDTLLGLVPDSPWTVTLHGRPLQVRSPRHAVRLGIASVSGDRGAKGLLPTLTILENMMSARRVARRRWLVGRDERQAAAALLQRLGIKASDLDALPSTLSGGTQQKLLLARWLEVPLEVLLLEEPTRGVDAHTKTDIYALIRALGKQGTTVIWWSSEQAELLEVCDRIVTFTVTGHPTRVLQAAGADDAAIVAETGVA